MLYLDVTPHQDHMVKGKAVSKLRSDNFFMMQASVFISSIHASVKEDIVKAWGRALVALYGGKQNEILDDLRLHSIHSVVHSEDQ